MTTICVKVSEDGNRVVFGSDRMMSVGQIVYPMSHPKWQKIAKDIWVSIAGIPKLQSFMASNVSLIREAIANYDSDPAMLSRNLCVIAELAGIREKDGDYDGLYPYTGMIFSPGNGLWEFDSDFDVNKVTASEFHAKGTGRTFAYGAAEALKNIGASDFDIVKGALFSAGKYDKSTGGPFDIFELGSDFQVKHYEFQ